MMYVEKLLQGQKVQWKTLREDEYIEIATTVEKINTLRADIDKIVKEIEL